MKYAAIAGFAAVATALTPREPAAQWEPVVPVVKSSTWSTWVAPVVKTDTWSNYPPKPAPTTWKADPTWDQWKNAPVYTTTVVTAITTYCPSATTIVHAGKTWTVTAATTLTITDCPCTISVPVYVKTSTSCPSVKTPVMGDQASTWVNAPVAPAKTPVAAASTWVNTPVAAASTWVNTPVAATPAAATTWSPVGVYKGAAVSNSINFVVLGAGAVAGAAALLL